MVACFVLGAKWQFKGWPFEGSDRGDLVRVFDQVRGFYVKYKDEKVPDDVRSWNVKVLSVDKVNRYEDAAVARSFWEEVDYFIRRTARLRDNVLA